MGYKTILVHINDERRLPGLLDVATALARQHGAHLIGLSVLPPIIIYPGGETSFAIPAIIESHRDAYRLEEARMKALFEKVTGEQPQLGAFTAEWRSIDAGTLPTAAEALLPVARSVDLVIASQADPKWNSSHMLDVPDRLATDSGRPVLVVPNAPHRPFSTKRILVAWNGRREATRAVYDALPLLRKADDVAVTWLAYEDDTAMPGDIPAADLCTTLARHGVKCQALAVVDRKGSAGEALLFEAQKFDWDLLVMGCYGHSRFREFILGGASRHVLGHATVPILMSH